MTKMMAVPAIALSCLMSDGGGIQADFVVAEFDDRRERIEFGRTADEAGRRRLDIDDRCLVEHAQSQGNWDRADIETVRLAPDVFRSLSADVVADLTRRRCVIPQPWLATEPANVVHGRFTVPGRTDAAVLCSKDRVSSILVYRGNSTEHVDELAPVADLGYLQDVGRGRIGFSRAIGVADAERVQHGLRPTAAPSHETYVDGIEDFFLEKASSIWYWHDGKWLQLEGSD
ncbi:MAG: hypothetical protein J4G19_07755 [Pseudomonadales bacterium]|nr:hypothetical protein [Pseudomonadales bacterium]